MKKTKLTYKKERYKFTQPINKNRTTDYILYMKLMRAAPENITSTFVNSHLHKARTFQSFVEKGLVKSDKACYRLTQKGESYLSYVESGLYTKKSLSDLVEDAQGLNDTKGN